MKKYLCRRLRSVPSLLRDFLHPNKLNFLTGQSRQYKLDSLPTLVRLLLRYVQCGDRYIVTGIMKCEI